MDRKPTLYFPSTHPRAKERAKAATSTTVSTSAVPVRPIFSAPGQECFLVVAESDMESEIRPGINFRFETGRRSRKSEDGEWVYEVPARK